MAPRGAADALRRAPVPREGAVAAAKADSGAAAVGEMSCPGGHGQRFMGKCWENDS